ncbi:MAG: PAS domain-containing protein [Ignavibacteriae bacterium]|nr:PAS domain S-box protein [Ignavibacteriota bacterium]NOG99393.1 PAS domain-containing protein [Ignavibacteriota bacterium]
MIKRRVIFGILTVLVLAAGFLIINLYKEVEEQVIEQLLLKQEIYTKQASKSIESFFGNLSNSLHYLSQNEHIINADKNLDDELNKYFNSNRDELKAVTRISADGIILSTIPVNKTVIGRDVSFQKHNAQIIESHKPIISDVILAVQGYRAIVYAYPVFKNGNYNGCISVVIPFSLIAEEFLEEIKIGKTGYALVISEEGIELFCTVSEHIGGSIVSGTNQSPRFNDMIKKMLEGKSGRAKYVQNWKGTEYSNGVENHAAYRKVDLGNTFWSIAVTVSEDEVLAVNRGFILKLVIIGTVLGVLLFVTMLIYIRYRNRTIGLLKQSEEKHRIVLEQTGQLIYEFNPSTIKITWGGAIEELTGFTQEEFDKIGYEECLEFIHPEDKDEQLKKINSSIKNQVNYRGEYRLRVKNGSYIYVQNNAGFLLDKEKNSIRFFGAVRNITEQKDAEYKLLKYQQDLEGLVKVRTAELDKLNKTLKDDIKRREQVEEELKNAIVRVEKSEKLKTEFLAQMSHEIRTPINTILSFSDLIKDELGKYADDELSYGFTGMQSAGIRIIRTIDLILNMSELQTDTYEYKPKRVDIYNDVIKKLKIEYARLADEKGLDFLISGNYKNTIIHADEYAVFQIFANLIDNAIKYTNSGKIEIKFYSNGADNLKISVADTGIGISEEFLPNLFTTFTQEEGGYTRKFEGNGLGLALIKKYCELNNAVIEVESKKHIGSTFTVSFPIK